MSLTGKLLSAALTVGTAAAVGYGLKKLEQKIQTQSDTLEHNRETASFGTADSTVHLKQGEDSYWRYSIKDKGVVKRSAETGDDAKAQFRFIPLKDGVTELEFDCLNCKDNTPSKTITYSIEVKNGKIIRFDAAGDLEMLDKTKNCAENSCS